MVHPYVVLLAQPLLVVFAGMVFAAAVFTGWTLAAAVVGTFSSSIRSAPRPPC